VKHSGFVGAARPRVADDSALPDRSAATAAPAKLVRESALEEVRQAIASGALKPGSRLTERSLCETFGVSRTLAREIVRQLEAERLVDVIPHRGLRIAVLAPQDVREIYAIRAELEVIIVKSFIATATEDDLLVMRQNHDALNVAAEVRDVPEIVNLVTRFLRHMIEVSGSKVAGELLDHLLGRINMLRVYAMNAPGQLDISVQQMNRIVESILARDAVAAEQAVRDYVETAGRSALRQLKAV
jgi:DNA-binding GntR family transcriptional regulator